MASVIACGLAACAAAELPRDCVPPDAPTALSAVPLSKLRIRIAWSHSGNADVIFRVEQSEDGGVSWAHRANTQINGRTVTSTRLADGVTYRYRVRAFNRCGSSAWSNEASATARP